MARRPPKPPGHEPNPRYKHSRNPQTELPSETKERSLRELSRSRISEDEFATAMSELTGTSDRTACIICSAMVERDLENLLIIRLGIQDKSLESLLFERDGALSTFYGNILLGRALGFYDKEFQNHFDIIRRIRNAFAHSAVPLSFSFDEVKRELNKLPNKRYRDATANIDFGTISEERRQFMACCLVIEQMIALVLQQVVFDEQITTTALSFYRSYQEKRRRKT